METGRCNQAGLSPYDNAVLSVISARNKKRWQFDALRVNPGNIGTILTGGGDSYEGTLYDAALDKLLSVNVGSGNLGNFENVDGINIGRRVKYVANWSGKASHSGGILINHTEFY